MRMPVDRLPMSWDDTGYLRDEIAICGRRGVLIGDGGTYFAVPSGGMLE